MPIAGVYTASQSDPYWAEMLATTGGDNQPGSLAVLDRDAFLALEAELEDSGHQSWTFAIEPGADLDCSRWTSPPSSRTASSGSTRDAGGPANAARHRPVEPDGDRS